jgi:hypothetical protein
MNQITKFYITSFLKNQTYFTPVLIIFLQAQSLTFQQIFWVFTIGSIFSFIIEIPTGYFAEAYSLYTAVLVMGIILIINSVFFYMKASYR